MGAIRTRVAERRKERERREVIAKHVKKGTASPEAIKAASERPARAESAPAVTRVKAAAEKHDEDDEEDAARSHRVASRAHQLRRCRRGRVCQLRLPCRCRSPSPCHAAWRSVA